MVLHVMTVAHIEIVKSGTGRELTVTEVAQVANMVSLNILLTYIHYYIYLYICIDTMNKLISIKKYN